MIDRDEIMKNARLAGQVERYHTWPRINRQSVAEHTFHILRIYYQLWGAPSPEVTERIIWHDIGEMATGDLPYPVKKVWPGLKEITTTIESAHLISLGIRMSGKVPDEEINRLKVCDLLEMLEYGLVERYMGNQFAEPIVVDIAANITLLLENLSGDDRFAVWKYMDINWGFNLLLPGEKAEEQHENT